MVNFWQGESVTLSANASGTIRIRVATDGEVTQFFVYSTGRARIDDIEFTGYEDIFDGEMEIDHFKMHGNVYPLPEPIPVKSGMDIVISLTDLSGATNRVSWAIRITKA